MLDFILDKRFYLPIIYILIGIIIYFIISGIVNKILNMEKNKKNKKKETIISLIKNILKYLIAIIVILSILAVYGVDTTTLIASLGVIAFVVGLAFQDIVKDFLAGITIIFDNQYTIGDIIEINGFKGEVIELGLKTTKIKSDTNEVKIISNSSFNEVINYSIYHYKLILDLPVAYSTDLNNVEKALKSIESDLLNITGVKNIIYCGLDKMDESSLLYKLGLECDASKRFTIKRMSLKLIKETFDKNNITIPFNQLDVYIKKEN